MNTRKCFEDLIVRNKSYFTRNGCAIERYTYFCGCCTEWDCDKVVDKNCCTNHPEKI